MATSNNSTTLSDLLGIEEEEVDYGSDTVSKPSTPMCDNRPKLAPYPFLERGDADALSALYTTPGMGSPIVTNPLNEQQEQVLQERESAQRRTHIMATLAAHSDYVFTPLSIEELLRQTVGQLLVSWNIVSAASTPEAVEERGVLRERYLVPTVMTQS